jgi:capsular polysaccharide transport system permease protein
MREILIRWGRRDFGFAWVFLEPMVFAMPVVLMWRIVRGKVEHGIPLVPFMWSGYMGMLVWRHVTGVSVLAIRSNVGALFHRRVTPLDIILARSSLEAAGGVSATLFSFFVFYGVGLIDWPVNPPLFVLGFLFMCWWSLAIGLILAGLTERSELVVHVWQPIGYMYLPFSGFFFLNCWLPEKVRNLALTLMPSVHAYDMLRGGMLGNRFPLYYDQIYLSKILIVLTFIGLWLVHNSRKHLELQ